MCILTYFRILCILIDFLSHQSPHSTSQIQHNEMNIQIKVRIELSYQLTIAKPHICVLHILHTLHLHIK